MPKTKKGRTKDNKMVLNILQIRRKWQRSIMYNEIMPVIPKALWNHTLKGLDCLSPVFRITHPMKNKNIKIHCSKVLLLKLLSEGLIKFINFSVNKIEWGCAVIQQTFLYQKKS